MCEPFPGMFFREAQETVTATMLVGTHLKEIVGCTPRAVPQTLIPCALRDTVAQA